MLSLVVHTCNPCTGELEAEGNEVLKVFLSWAAPCLQSTLAGFLWERQSQPL